MSLFILYLKMEADMYVYARSDMSAKTDRMFAGGYTWLETNGLTSLKPVDRRQLQI